ncbi:MAG: PhnD/SsuA/transferrin family substrate-binding protein [Pararhodobacter sp.]
MPRQKGLTRRGLLAALAAVAMPASPALAQTRPFVLALTPVLMTSDLDLLALLRNYLSQALGLPVQLATRRSYQDVTMLVLGGKVDAAWVCGYPYVVHRDQLDVLAVPVWRGAPVYESFLIVARDAPARDWRDLDDDLHAFSDPDSNSGYLVTAALLARHGRRVESFFRGTMFTYEHRNVIRAVASGLAQSGSVDGYIWEVMTEVEPELGGATRVLRRSEPLGFPPVVTSPAFADPGRSTALREALVSMAGDSQGQALLRELRLDGFVDVPVTHFDGIAAQVAALRQN